MKPALLGRGERADQLAMARGHRCQLGVAPGLETGIGERYLQPGLLDLKLGDGSRQRVEFALLLPAQPVRPRSRRSLGLLDRRPRRRLWPPRRRALPQVVAIAADILRDGAVALDRDHAGDQPVEE